MDFYWFFTIVPEWIVKNYPFWDVQTVRTTIHGGFVQSQDLEHFDTKVSGQWGAGCGVSIPGFDERHVYIYIFNNIYIVNIYIYTTIYIHYIYILYIYTLYIYIHSLQRGLTSTSTSFCEKNRTDFACKWFSSWWRWQLRLCNFYGPWSVICWSSKVLSSEDLKTQRTESGLTQCRKDKKGALMLGLNPMHLWEAAVELSMAPTPMRDVPVFFFNG